MLTEDNMTLRPGRPATLTRSYLLSPAVAFNLLNQDQQCVCVCESERVKEMSHPSPYLESSVQIEYGCAGGAT